MPDNALSSGGEKSHRGRQKTGKPTGYKVDDIQDCRQDNDKNPV
jgi:hypothetical protein